MKGPRSEKRRAEKSLATDRPAVGIRAPPNEGEEVAAAILRCQSNGYEALVIRERPGTADAVKYANQLDAGVVSAVSRKNGDDPKNHLRKESKRLGFPGLIYQENPSDRVGFDESTRALHDSDQYITDAVPKPTVESTPDILVAIPAYNEEVTIADVVTHARHSADEVIVIDDGSTDETATRAREAGATTIEHESNRGYGAALKSAFREAKRCDANHLVVLDGDGQHDPTDIPELVERQQSEEAELVIGSRFLNESQTSLPFNRHIGIQIINILTNVSLGVVRSQSWVTDTQSGFRAYNSRAIKSLTDDDSIGDGMCASTDILHHAHRYDYSIEEVETTIDYDVENASNQNPISHGLHLVRNILRTIEQERPIAALGVPGFASSLVGVWFGYLTVANFVSSGLFRLGLALLTAFFVLAGIFACFTAIILHSLNQHFG